MEAWTGVSAEASSVALASEEPYEPEEPVVLPVPKIQRERD